ncbi:DUF924 domain-containing protein [Alphaproteobacteria bacterium]|nr:DUF924 domain-containing protein [Alphaproteobacteria bacterium]
MIKGDTPVMHGSHVRVISFMQHTIFPNNIIRFWMQHVNDWLEKPQDLDKLIQADYEHLVTLARKSVFLSWEYEWEGCFALIILLSALPRNLYRDSLRAYVSDKKAISLAKKMCKRGWDHYLSNNEKIGIYLPFIHYEDLEKLEEQMPRIQQTQHGLFIAMAQDRLDQLQKFGRFPHRNDILGRRSTPEEQDYLRILYTHKKGGHS